MIASAALLAALMQDKDLRRCVDDMGEARGDLWVVVDEDADVILVVFRGRGGDDAAQELDRRLRPHPADDADGLAHSSNASG